MHRGYIYAKIPQLPSFYKYLYPEICRCPSLRLRKATIESLKDLHLAFEVAYLHQFSNDQFIQKMIDCIEDGDPAVWDAYLEIVSKRENNH